jgi:hypothetical protein
MDLIVLNAGQANAVRGPAGPFAALDPVQLADARWLLGEEVLDDAAHGRHRGFLEARPRVTHAEIAHLLPHADLPE